MKELLKHIASVLLFLFSFYSCQKKFLCPDCENKPPVARAGVDQKITLPKDSVTLDATASTDPDGKIVSYKWLKIAGPTSNNIIKASSPVTSVKGLVMGVYKFELTVTDDGGLSAKDTIQAIVDDPKVNQPPVASAGIDQTITLPADSVLLDGRASFDPDGTIVSYKWIKISGPASTINKPDSSSTVVKNLIAGLYQFELMVKDNGGLTSKDTIKVLVDIPGNHPPVACAGVDQTIALPLNTVTINASCSTDPDNDISTYLWSKISGPISFNLSTPNSIQTQVTNLVQGIYLFEIKVTDLKGSFTRDTLQVMVTPAPILFCGYARPVISARLTPVGMLSQIRTFMTVAAAGNKILFAGGAFGSDAQDGSSRVDIYDVITNSWSQAELSVPRWSMGATSAGNKIFFAGGGTFDALNNPKMYRDVDIYDVTNNSWETDTLSMRRMDVAAASLGGLAFFAGGYTDDTVYNGFSSRIDIYDPATKTWSRGGLTEGRTKLTAVVAGNKIYFGGGISSYNVTSTGVLELVPSTRIDVYTPPGGTSFANSPLSEARYYMAGFAAGNNVYWVGGVKRNPFSFEPQYISCTIDVKDVSAASSPSKRNYLNIPSYFFSGGGQTAVMKDNKIILFHGSREIFSSASNQFDIYDMAIDQWSVAILPLSVEGASIISVNNTIYVAGGFVDGFPSAQVFKLDF